MSSTYSIGIHQVSNISIENRVDHDSDGNPYGVRLIRINNGIVTDVITLYAEQGSDLEREIFEACHE